MLPNWLKQRSVYFFLVRGGSAHQEKRTKHWYNCEKKQQKIAVNPWCPRNPYARPTFMVRKFSECTSALKKNLAPPFILKMCCKWKITSKQGHPITSPSQAFATAFSGPFIISAVTTVNKLVHPVGIPENSLLSDVIGEFDEQRFICLHFLGERSTFPCFVDQFCSKFQKNYFARLTYDFHQWNFSTFVWVIAGNVLFS